MSVAIGERCQRSLTPHNLSHTGQEYEHVPRRRAQRLENALRHPILKRALLASPRLDDALDAAIALAEEEGDLGGAGVLVTGSIVTVAEARTLLGGS